MFAGSSFIVSAAQLILLAVAFTMVLAGLRLWKFYVGFLGALFGLFAGMALASWLFDARPVVLALGLAGALVGTWVAWPLQKAVVFAAAGAAVAMLGAALLPAVAVHSYAQIALFVLGGLLSLWLFQPFIIVALAVAAARMAMAALGGGACPFATWGLGLPALLHVFDGLGRIFALPALLWVGYALLVQLVTAPCQGDAPEIAARKKIFRAVGWLCALLLLFDLLLAHLGRHVSLCGLITPVWPLQAAVAGAMALVIHRLGERKRWTGLLLAAITCVLLVPAIGLLNVGLPHFGLPFRARLLPLAHGWHSLVMVAWRLLLVPGLLVLIAGIDEKETE